MNIEEFRIICDTTVKLTQLRQNECKHLCIENIAPEIMGKLIAELQASKAKNAGEDVELL